MVTLESAELSTRRSHVAFASQSHMTELMRRKLGVTPHRLRMGE